MILIVSLLVGVIGLFFTPRQEDPQISVPMIDIHTMGAGGGSIASVGPGGIMQVGPKSAGALPGPASYDKGGDRPTVTDANLALGYLDPGNFRDQLRAIIYPAIID